MSSKRRSGKGTGEAPKGAGSAGRPTSSGRGAPASPSRRRWVLAGVGLAVVLVAVGRRLGRPLRRAGRWRLRRHRASPAPGAPAGTVIQANGGHWTNITPDTLAGMMKAKDFTLLNVKTPYIGEIAGTDLYIPYTAARRARDGELPADKTAKIVVYCRSGNESAIAAQTLLDLGYTNIENLDGGMNAWLASGRQIVQQNRS